VPAHTALSAQNWLLASCPDFIRKGQWPSHFQNINPVVYPVCDAMLEAFCKIKTKPKTIAEVQEALHVIWGNLPQGPIDKALKDFSS